MKSLLLSLFLFLFSITQAQVWEQTHKVVASDRASDDYFGFSGVITNNQLIIGAYRNRPAGAVYVFDKTGDTWTESYRLLRNATDSYDEFGRRIIADGNTIVVSDYSTNNSSLYDIGSVYIYKKDNAGIWTEQAELYANTPRQYGKFGLETGLDNNTLVVGSDLGNVNVYEFNTAASNWDFIQEITTTDGLTSDAAVDVNGNHIVVGSFDFDENGDNNTGAAYVFEKDNNTGNWTQLQKILSPDLAAGQRFGKKVFFYNNFLFIASVEFAKVYVYTLDTSNNQYTHQQTLSGASGFGQAIDAENGRLIIGSYRHSYTNGSSSSIPQAGSFSTFLLNDTTQQWDFEENVKNTDPDNYYWFGNSVSISNGVVLAGSPYNDTDENLLNDREKAGASYVFELSSTLSTPNVEVSEFKVYPNPTSGEIHLTNAEYISNIQLLDVTGKLIKHLDLNGNSLTLQGLNTGVYILKITTPTHATVFKKVLKQ